ncbi:hypothetical protein AB4Y32_09765 [Paraburkholderia phymatum]|uniref:Uncharacterized protein n=1 Tax=Paraburkholderia phymatum TaxID=148447 RepID=A0ACC6TXC6_9BURK
MKVRLSPARPALPVVLVYRGQRKTDQIRHEIDTHRELARLIAELKGTTLADEFGHGL